MPEIYEDIEKLVVQFIKDGTDKGRITTRQIINGCSHTCWKEKQVREALKAGEESGIIAMMSNTTQWYMVKQ